MKTIHKYPLLVQNTQFISTRVGARLLCVQAQGFVPTIWAEVDDTLPMDSLLVLMHGTGHPLPDNAETYLGSVQLDGFVWHYYFQS